MRLAVVLGSLASTNILLGFLYQWYVVTHLGPGAETDALYAGMVIPQLILAVLMGSLAHVLVPSLANQRGRQFCHDAWFFFQSVGLLFGGITCVLLVTAGFWVPWTVPGFNTHTTLLTVSLVQIQLVGTVFTALTMVLWSVNHARQRFVWVELSSIIANMIGFGFLIRTLSDFGIMAAAWAMVLRAFLQTFLLLGGLGPYTKADWHSESIREAWRRLRPLIFGTTYYKTDQLVDRFLASMAPVGSLTLLHMAQQLYGSGNAILTKSIATPMVPLLATKAQGGDWKTFHHIFFKRLLAMAGVTGLGFLVIFVFGKPLLSLLFGPKRFGAENVNTLWWLLIALVGMWIGGDLGAITSNTFYAKGDTKTPTKLGIWTYTLYVPIKVLSFVLFSLTGLAISISIFYLVNFSLQFYILRKGFHESK
jgi:putative peptidoglycan lipid II flippase